MSPNKQFASGPDGKPPREKAEPPTCPQCQHRMTVKQVTPVLFASQVDDMVFGCDRCGTEAKRTVRQS